MLPLDVSPAFLARLGSGALAMYVVACVVQVVTAPVAKLPFPTLEALAVKRFGKSKDPLKGKIAIVTGSTNGLGEQIAAQLYRLGAEVIIASRTNSKCEVTSKKIESEYPESSGKITTHTLDTSDLKNVQSFVAWFQGQYKQLDFLVNNAGGDAHLIVNILFLKSLHLCIL